MPGTRLVILLAAAALLSACLPGPATENQHVTSPVPAEHPTNPPPSDQAQAPAPNSLQTSGPSPTAGTPAPPISSGRSNAASPDVLLPEATDLARETPPPLATLEFPNTDFSRHSVSFAHILSGGPPRDGIRPLDNPAFVDVAQADGWLDRREPVILVQIADQAWAFPIQIMIFHEIANTELAGLPVMVSFCPLCNTAIVFMRQAAEHTLSFSSTGRLRFSNLVMYDRETESWWQQATGEAIIGELLGTQLDVLPASMIAWDDFRRDFPDGLVLSRATGSNRQYGFNPYLGYDSIDDSPFLYEGPPISGRLPALARVLTLDLNNQAVAYPYAVLSQEYVVNDEIGWVPVVIFWQPGAVSPLDAVRIAEGREIGSAAAYSRVLAGQTLEFVWQDGSILDQQTGSHWSVTGVALSGELAGQQLQPVLSINHFWFSWAAFKPETEIYAASRPE